jgi:hypothetical protein
MSDSGEEDASSSTQKKSPCCLEYVWSGHVSSGQSMGIWLSPNRSCMQAETLRLSESLSEPSSMIRCTG